MWIQFFIATLVAFFILFVPGFGPIRALGFDLVESICFSPAVSVALISVVCLAYGQVGIFSNWATVLLPLSVLSITLTAFAHIREAKYVGGIRDEKRRLDTRILMLYLGVATVVSTWFFVRTLNGASSFSQEHDNIHHLLQIKEFLATGDMSTLHVNLYAIKEMKGIPTPFPVGHSFYPSGWHCVVALVASLVRCDIAVAQNAVIWAFLASVLPTATFLFSSRVFKGQRLELVSGSVLALAFAAFPWQMLIFGPLYPNFGAFCLVPLAVTAFMGICENWYERRWAYAVVFLLSGISLGIMHPNAIFSAALLLFPYCLLRITRLYVVNVREGKMGKPAAIALTLSFVVLFVVAWRFMYALPAFRGVTSFYWSQMSPPKDQLMNILTLSFRARSAQVFLGALVLTGFMSCARDEEKQWLAVSYLLLFTVCFVCGVGSEGIRSLVSGFWYNDLYRTGASMALVCLPLACRGFVLLDDLVARVVTSLGYQGFVQNRRLATSVVLVLCALVIYMPSFLIPGRAWITTAFGDVEDELLRENDVTSVIGPEEESLYYDVSDIFDLDDYLLAQPHELGIMATAESEFMADVANVVEKDALILNQPHDGSVFGNIQYDLNVFYLLASTPSRAGETFESRMVRTGLNLYGTSDLVRNAVDGLGADYVLLLDVDGSRSGTRYWYGHYVEADWSGLNAINDDTPGFEVVLSRGDMRLYRIVR